MPTGSSEGWALVWEGSLTTGSLLLADVILCEIGSPERHGHIDLGDSHQTLGTGLLMIMPTL